MLGDLIKRSDVLVALEKVFYKYNQAFGGNYGGFAEDVPKAVKEIPAAIQNCKGCENDNTGECLHCAGAYSDCYGGGKENKGLMEEPATDDEVRYCYSLDGERYYGSYATRAEALEDARSDASFHGEAYIGVCSEPELRWSCIEETVTEQITENLYDDVGEIADCFEVGAADETELKKRLDAAIAGWIRDRNIKPGCYQVFEAQRVSIGEE